MGKAGRKRTTAMVMAMVVAVAAIPVIPVSVKAESLTEDSKWTYQGASVHSIAGNLNEKAVILGESAEIYEDEAQGKVLKLFGNSQQSGVLKLPDQLYKNVTDGFSISMDVNIAGDAGDYTRLFQSSCCEMGSKGAPWNSPGISIDLGGGNMWRTEVFVGKDTSAAAETENRNTGSTAVSRNAWHNVVFSVNKEKVVLKVDGEVYLSSGGDFSELFGSEKYLSEYVNNAIGDSIYSDSSVKAMIDNVKFYNSADVLNEDTLQITYDFENVEKVPATTTVGDANTYTDGTVLSQVNQISSPDERLVFSLQKDAEGRFFYSVKKDGEDMIYASRLGLETSDIDFGTGAEYHFDQTRAVTDTYQLYQGKHQGNISDTCTETTFSLEKAGKSLEVTVRVYDDGVAYCYGMKEGASIKKEVGEYVFPDQATLLSYTQPNVTYEGTYSEYSMNQVYQASASYTIPSLVSVNDHYVLLTEAAVFSEEDSYCSSYLKTTSESKNLTWSFGNKQSGAVMMKSEFTTPWRVAIIGDDLNTVVNSDIVTSLNPDAEDMDWSFIEPGKTAWSWWSSTGDDPIAFEPQKEYIDFAAENGWEYVCLDYGWILWDDYKAKVKELADYAKEKGVGLWLWYGVNDTGHTAAGAYPKHSLLSRDNITTEFEWASSIGIRGVKVDYYESDNQSTMNQMYLCADIAAENHLMVLFHGCTNPGGENRTFPNVISYEAVYGAEYYKWRSEPSTKNIINYLFTRNAIGSADFTPTALPVANINATYGFMLATCAYIESGIVHYAENVNVYEGYNGLSFLNALPVSWEETKVLEGEIGSYGTVARRAGESWVIAALSAKERNTALALDFLSDGKEYTAILYKTAENNKGLEIQTQKVTADTIIELALAKDDGVAIYISEDGLDIETAYEKKYHYYEAEAAKKSGAAVLSENQYASGKQVVGYLGNGEKNAIEFTIQAEEAGVYELKPFYVSGADRRYEIKVNGAEAIRTQALNSGDWVSVAQTSLYITLEKGENTIVFTNSKKDAPNLDRIAVSKAKTEKEPTKSDDSEDAVTGEDGSKYQYIIYEAEQALISNAQKNATTVGWLGNSADSYVLFEDVTVDEAGEYYLMIQYFSGEDREVYVSVNGEDGMVVACKSSGAWSEYASQSYVKVKLNTGKNTIKIYHPTAYCPDLDAIGISTTRTDAPDNLGEDTKPEKETTGKEEMTSGKTEEITSTETPATDKGKEEATPKTGDERDAQAYIVIFLASMILVVKFLLDRKYCRR